MSEWSYILTVSKFIIARNGHQYSVTHRKCQLNKFIGRNMIWGSGLVWLPELNWLVDVLRAHLIWIYKVRVARAHTLYTVMAKIYLNRKFDEQARINVSNK